MEYKNILLAAKILFNHRLNKSELKNLPKNLTPTNIEESYKIQNELKLLYLSLNNNFTIGKKVGCTNKLAQKQLNIFEPFYGNLFSKFSDESGCKLKSSKFLKPYIECEISYRIKEDININAAQSTPHTLSIMLNCLKCLLIVLLTLKKQQILQKILLRILVVQVILVQNCMMYFQ